MIYEATIGSHMHGLQTSTSDIDTRSIYITPLIDLLDPYEEQKIKSVIRGSDDHVSYELRHFLKLLGKGSPSIIDILYSELFTAHTEAGIQLRSRRYLFIDKDMAVKSIIGYSLQMIKNAKNGERPLKSIRSAILTSSVVLACLQDAEYNSLTNPLRNDIIDICREDDEQIVLSNLIGMLLYPLLNTIETTSYTNHFNRDFVRKFTYTKYTGGV